MNPAQLSTSLPGEAQNQMQVLPRKKGAFTRIRADIQSVFDRDPAARSVIEVLLTYPGLHAIWGHRLAHAFWQRGFKLLGRWISQLMRGLTGIEIHPGATLG